MFYWLVKLLADLDGPFNLFRYITFRAAGAMITAFLLSLVFGPLVLKLLGKYGLREIGDEDRVPELAGRTPGKSGTPTMGGVLICGALLMSSLLWCRFDNNPYVILGFGVVALFGAIGYLDDSIKVKGVHGGLKALVKLALMTGGSVGVGYILFLYAQWDGKESHLGIVLPLLKGQQVNMAWWLGIPWLFWCWLILSGMGNGVNITDGLDGLAVGLSTMVALTLAVVCYLAGRRDFSSYLFIPYVSGVGEMAIMLAAMAGACLGFLWFNCSPALVFMGDTGSLPLGGLLGLAALAARQELVLLIAGGIFVWNSLSVLIQVGSYKTFGKRVFRITPMHHIPQLNGLPESRIVVRYWIGGVMLCLFSLALLKIR